MLSPALYIYIYRKHNTPTRKSIVIILIPFVVFLLLKLISEIILAPATGNTSDLARATVQNFFNNTEHYYNHTYTFFKSIINKSIIIPLRHILLFLSKNNADIGSKISSFCNLSTKLLVYSAFLLIIIGVIFEGLKKEFHLTLFSLVYFIVVCALPYKQGARYIYPILILFPMYIGHATNHVLSFIKSHISHRSKTAQRLLSFIACMICIVSFTVSIKEIFSSANCIAFLINRTPTVYNSNYDAYTTNSIEIYRYIIDNTSENCVIGFRKPRALYLNTGRVSIYTNNNDHSLDEVDYYLYSKDFDDEQVIVNKEFKLVYSNEDFNLYKK